MPGRDANHSPPSSAAVMEELCYTFTHPLGLNRVRNGNTITLLLLLLLLLLFLTSQL